MSVVYLIGSIVSALLFAYLLVALVKPEWFS
jgi:K+-transporting ATPase KdpF subunit